jgi:NADPH:quinone reductase-like Zn-dependent oxidoreductase
MRAVVQSRYGSPDHLTVREVDVPAVADDEVLVQVRAASVHPDVWHVVTGRPAVLRLMGGGVRRPRNAVPGTDLAGVVESVGSAVTRFAAGDEVFGETIRGMQWANGGAYAEYAAVPETGLATKPATVSFEQAATVPTAGLILMQNLAGGLRPRRGQRVLVNGAGGGVGSIALQLAAADGAEVTAVDSAAKQDLLRELGADHVLDYERTDFTKGTTRYDLVIDVPGNHSFAECRRVLNADGTYVLIGHDGFGTSAGRWVGSLRTFVPLMARTPFTRQLPPLRFTSIDKAVAMAELAGLLQSGALAPRVDRAFPLDEAAAAIRHLASGRALGRVVLVPGPPV